MPSVTLTFSTEHGVRIQKALVSTPFPETAAGFKALVSSLVIAWVKEYERNERLSVALAAIPPLADIEVT